MAKMTFGKFYESGDKPFKLYCDLDGVLCNWEKEWDKLRPGVDYDSLAPGEGHPIIAEEGGEEFWSEMEWLPDGKKLWEFVKQFNPTILSSPIRDGSCITGKNKWIDRELGKDVPRILDRDKGQYADEKSILIDDYESRIEEWAGNDGTGILHTSTEDTINQLKEILGLDENLDAKYDSKSKPVGKKWSSKKFFNTKKLNKRSQVFDFN